MTKVLITGMGGTGKSAICSELLHKGFRAYDGDRVNGLARWEDKETHLPVAVDHTQFVDYSKVEWRWSQPVLRTLLNTDETIFLCGSATNALDFYDEFDVVGILVVSADQHRNRLNNRSSSYGKDLQTIEWIVATQPEYVQKALDLGAIAIDANGGLEETVQKVIDIADL